MDHPGAPDSPSPPVTPSDPPGAEPRTGVLPLLLALSWVAVAYGCHYYHWGTALTGPTFLPRYLHLLFGR